MFGFHFSAPKPRWSVGLLVLFVIGLLLLGAGAAQAAGRPAIPAQQVTPPAGPPALSPGLPVYDPKAVGAASAPNPQTLPGREPRRFQPVFQLTRGQALVAPNSAQAVKPTSAPPANLQSPFRSRPAAQPVKPGSLSAAGWSMVAPTYDFETIAVPGPAFRSDDFSASNVQAYWGDTSAANSALSAGSWSVWPAAKGVNKVDPTQGDYPANLNTWMRTGAPLDFSNMTDVFVSFDMYYETEPNYDFVSFCASVDDITYYCEKSWSGYANWDTYNFWMTSYAGYSQVWFAWIFTSDGSNPTKHWGPYLDNVNIWADDGVVPPPPTPDPAGQFIQNPGFETNSLSPWSTSAFFVAADLRPAAPAESKPAAAVQAAEVTAQAFGAQVLDLSASGGSAEGNYAALLSGSGQLYQTINIPSNLSNLTLSYWFAITTTETYYGYDFFCASLRTSDLVTTLVNLGCIDALDGANYWQQAVFNVSDATTAGLGGQQAALVFELYNDASAPTYVWLDLAEAYGTGGASGGRSLDPNEPNDSLAAASALTCGAPLSGTIGNELGGADDDWFHLTNVPAGALQLDVNARSLVPNSELDSVMTLYNGAGAVIDQNDDDGSSLDSFLSYTNTVVGADFYVLVQSYSGVGSANSFYQLGATCNAAAGSGGGETGGGAAISGAQPLTGTWTVMLYLNAEDKNFESTLLQYRHDIEAYIGAKKNFMTVTVLYDGPAGANSASMRYVIQPGGAYTDNENSWNMGELNMGDPSTLANFATWSMDQFPADHYYLAVDDHGDGAYGISWDPASNNDQLTAPELASAIKSATRDGQRKIDIFDYEACLMGLTENAYDLRAWVDYVVFFEQISWGINTYPEYFRDLARYDPPLTVGQRIVARYHAGANQAEYPHTISFVDTSQLPALNSALSTFANALRASSVPTNTWLNLRNASQGFAADSDATKAARAEYIDLWSFAQQVASAQPAFASQANALKAAVQAAVKAEAHSSGRVDGYVWDHSGAHGLSIYYPPTQTSSAFERYVSASSPLYTLSADGFWDEYLSAAVPLGRGRGMNTSRAESRLLGGTTAVFRYQYLPAVRRGR